MGRFKEEGQAKEEKLLFLKRKGAYGRRPAGQWKGGPIGPSTPRSRPKNWAKKEQNNQALKSPCGT